MQSKALANYLIIPISSANLFLAISKGYKNNYDMDDISVYYIARKIIFKYLFWGATIFQIDYYKYENL